MKQSHYSSVVNQTYLMREQTMNQPVRERCHPSHENHLIRLSHLKLGSAMQQSNPVSASPSPFDSGEYVRSSLNEPQLNDFRNSMSSRSEPKQERLTYDIGM